MEAPAATRQYPTYDVDRASGPAFVDYVNDLLSGVPASEPGLFERFARIGLLSNTVLTDEAEVQAGIDAALSDTLQMEWRIYRCPDVAHTYSP